MGADTGMTARETQDSLQIRLRQREAEIEMLREVSDVIGGTYSLQKVFDLVADRARNLIDAETVTIPILTPDQSTYTYRAAVGEHADELISATLPLEIGVCGWVFRHRRPWWRGMLNQLDEHERNRWEKEVYSLQSMTSAPAIRH